MGAIIKIKCLYVRAPALELVAGRVGDLRSVLANEAEVYCGAIFFGTVNVALSIRDHCKAEHQGCN